MKHTVYCDKINEPLSQAKKVRSFTAKFKLEVIQYIQYTKEHGNRTAEKYFSVNERNIREWRSAISY